MWHKVVFKLQKMKCNYFFGGAHARTSGDLTKTKNFFTAKTIDLGSYLKVFTGIKEKK